MVSVWHVWSQSDTSRSHMGNSDAMTGRQNQGESKRRSSVSQLVIVHTAQITGLCTSSRRFSVPGRKSDKAEISDPYRVWKGNYVTTPHVHRTDGTNIKIWP
jgi:hypothetical protein